MKVIFQKIPPGTAYFPGRTFNVPDHRAQHFIDKGYAVSADSSSAKQKPSEKKSVDLNNLKVDELKELATEKGIAIPASLTKKADIIEYLYQELGG